jgi:hypothetical protein
MWLLGTVRKYSIPSAIPSPSSHRTGSTGLHLTRLFLFPPNFPGSWGDRGSGRNQTPTVSEHGRAVRTRVARTSNKSTCFTGTSAWGGKHGSVTVGSGEIDAESPTEVFSESRRFVMVPILPSRASCVRVRLANKPSTDRQEFDSVSHLVGRHDLRHQLQITDRLTNSDSELVCVRDSGELAVGILPLVADDEKIVVLREDDAAQTRCAFQ